MMILKSSRQQGDGPRNRRFLQWQGVGVRDAELGKERGIMPQSAGSSISTRPNQTSILQWPISPEEAAESDTALM